MSKTSRPVIMFSPTNSCPRCMGSGKTGFRPSGGICYKCNGSGKLGTAKEVLALTPEERATVAARMASRGYYTPPSHVSLADLPEGLPPEHLSDEEWLKALFAH